MYNPVLFKDRVEAGRKLGQELRKLNLKNPIVLAIPSGGVPVGIEVAKILNCPFDLIIARKIQFPWTTEAGFGAVTADEVFYLKEEKRRLPPNLIKIQTQKALQEVERREKEFLKRRKGEKISGKTVILVDDGLAAGSTMMVAIKSIRLEKPAQIIVAVPTASASSVKLLKGQADKIISLHVHPEGLPFAVASSYKNWHDLTNYEVKGFLNDLFNKSKNGMAVEREKQDKIIKLYAVLETLSQLFGKWGLFLDDYCLVGEWALLLYGYDIEGRKGIIDVYVDRESLPWKVKKERQIIPPRKSRYFNEWVGFTEQTKFGLDMIPIPESPTDPRTRVSIRKTSKIYQVPSGSKLRINTPLAEVEIHKWLFQQYTAEDIGKDNIQRWWEYIKNIKQAAMKKEDKKVFEACNGLLGKYGSF